MAIIFYEQTQIVTYFNQTKLMPTMIKFSDRLAVKQAKSTVLLAFVLGIFISLSQIYLDFFEVKQEFHQTLDQVLKIVEKPASEAAYSLDQEVAQDLLIGLFKYQPIFEAYIFDDSGKELASLQRQPATHQFRWITDFIFHESQEVNVPLFVTPPTQFFRDITPLSSGNLKVIVDTYQTGFSFLYRAGIIIASGLLRNMLLALILLLFFHRYLTKPFLKIGKDLEQIDPENPAKFRLLCPRRHEKDEFSVLVADTNRLLQTIEDDIEDRIEKAKEAQHLQTKIREREKREKELQAYQEQLEAANDELTQTLQTLRQTQNQLIESEKMAALGGLVAGVAHEVNTPVGIGLTAASHFTGEVDTILEKQNNQEMEEDDLNDFLLQSKQISEIIFTNMNKAADLIKSFKQVAVDQSSEEQRQFRVREYIREVLINMKYTISQTKHTITISEGDPIEMNSYPGSFSQLITNLLTNSLVHAYEKGEAGNIIFDLEKKEDILFLNYSDDGKGISDKDLKKIYEPFFTTKRGKGGTGLGLHIVYNLVTKTLGGSIQCTSKEGEGTTFAIQLPLTPQIT